MGDIYTMDRDFLKQEQIDALESSIWTERYYGNGDCELMVEPSKEMVQKFKKGTLIGHEDSSEPMITETLEIEKEQLKVSAITLTQWLNNRFWRTTQDPAIKEFLFNDMSPGELMSYIVQNWCVEGGIYLNDTVYNDMDWPETFAFNPNNMGVYASTFAIPWLSIAETYGGGANISVQVSFGGVYDALKAIGEAYEVGMRITLDYASEEYSMIGFRNYIGLDRTSTQEIRPLVRFSPDLESLTNIKEIQSLQDYADVVYTYPSQVNHFVAGWFAIPSRYRVYPFPEGFDLHVHMTYDDTIRPEDLSTPPIPIDETMHVGAPWESDDPGITATKMNALLEPGQRLYLSGHKGASIVDGEIIETDQFKYGTDFFMGDVVEIEGYSGAIQKARITEYIRSQDASGKKAFPTLTIIE